jgi:hypothetical protein
MCISHVIKKKDTCHFYRLGWRRFLQSSLEENSVLEEIQCTIQLFHFSPKPHFFNKYKRNSQLTWGRGSSRTWSAPSALRLAGRGPLRRSANVGGASLGLKLLILSPPRCSRGLGWFWVFFFAVFLGLVGLFPWLGFCF